MERTPDQERKIKPESQESFASREGGFLRHVSGHKLARLFLLVTALWGGRAFGSEPTPQEAPKKPKVTMLEGADPSNRRMEGRVARWLEDQGHVHRIETDRELARAIKEGKVERLENGPGYTVRGKKYLEAPAIAFIQTMGMAFVEAFPSSTFSISSAGRSEEHQRRVIEEQQNPFAADPRWSTHPYFTSWDLPFSSLGYRKTTVTVKGKEVTKDVFSQKLADEQMKWITDYLVQREQSRESVTKFENNNCFHVATFPVIVSAEVWDQLKAGKEGKEVKQTIPPVASL